MLETNLQNPSCSNRNMSLSSPENADILAQTARDHSMNLLHSYFTSQYNPLVRHHIDSYDQFLSTDLQTILTAVNPILNVKEALGTSGQYKYTCKIFLGGVDTEEEPTTPLGIYIGTPTVVLENGRTVRAMFPNEARMRNLTYGIQVEIDVLIKIRIQDSLRSEPVDLAPILIERLPLVTLPLMLHSKYCVLHGKPLALLQQMGECPQDEGGYFIVDGSEKILITSQEGAFNTLYIQEQKRDPQIHYYASILSLDPATRYTRRVSFHWTRERVVAHMKKGSVLHPSVLEVSLPGVLKPIPVFVLFRALGIQSDQEILKLLFGDMESPEAVYLADMLIPSMTQAAPIYDTWSAMEFIRLLTKGFGKHHVLDVLHNQMFPHVPDLPNARASFLAYCVRRILRVIKKIDAPPSKDDTRNQRLLTSGFLVQMEFQRIFTRWKDSVNRELSKLYNYNKASYEDEKFADLFAPGNQRHVFQLGFITKELMKSFKGKWQGTSRGDGDSGFLQALSRLSYLDFMSHCRRVILNFDTSMKLTGPRFLHTSQYGYFCTCETPSGASIGVTKNFSMLTRVSTNSPTKAFIAWLFTRGGVFPCEAITPAMSALMVPVFVNGGILGYTGNPTILTRVLRLMKRTACLPPLSSSHFDAPTRMISIYMDEGRPLRPLLICEPQGALPVFQKIQASWTAMVIGSFPATQSFDISSSFFVDPLADTPKATLEDYVKTLAPHQSLIEYVDPYEQNQILVANYPENIQPETTHMEVHPSTIMGLLGNMIPYPNFNQSPRNQLSASQSKQGVSLYASNFKNRYDNSAHVLCYGEAPLSRTIYQDYVGNGLMPYGQNIILAMGMYSGYNQEDGIIMNADALARGQFRSLYYKSYEAFEENDPQARTQTRIANPRNVPGWLDLKADVDYSKLDDEGLVRVGEFVDQNTVLVGRYLMNEKGTMRDASLTAQVWTSGRVESVSVMVANTGLRLVKIRVTQDRVPVLGDKFSNRHGQKGTANIFLRGHDMPRTADGIVPDMIMNPTAIPSRMTIGQIHEMMGGQMASVIGAITNATAFMTEGSPHEFFGSILEKHGFNQMGNHVLYNGTTGEQIEADIFIGVVYGMRLKHMTEDKWNARGEGRKEQRTHQPTGGRGNEGGLKIGEMERDAILAHGTSSFLQESMMARSDGTNFWICNGCGTIPLYNEGQQLFMCPLCDGPIKFTGTTPNDLEPIPATIRSATSFSRVQMPYASALFFQELNTFLTMGLRVLTTRDTTRLRGMDSVEQLVEAEAANLNQKLPERRVVEELPPEVEVAPTSEIQSEKDLEEERAAFEATVGAEDARSALPATTQEIRAQAAAETYAAQLKAAEEAEAVRRNPTLAPIPGILPLEGEDAAKGPVISVDTSKEALAPIAQQATQVLTTKPRRSRSPFAAAAPAAASSVSPAAAPAVAPVAPAAPLALPLPTETPALLPLRAPNEESPPYIPEGNLIPDDTEDVVLQQGTPAAAAASETPMLGGGRVNVVKLG